jgi:hypothetical protein
MKAILRTYHSEQKYTDQLVKIDDNHDWARGPYQDTAPFTVGSNQTILELEFTEKPWRPWPPVWSEIVIKRAEGSRWTDMFWRRDDGVLQYLTTT